MLCRGGAMQQRVSIAEKGRPRSGVFVNLRHDPGRQGNPLWFEAGANHILAEDST